jgi:predicted Zn-dependent protease
MFTYQASFCDGKCANSYQCLVTLTSHALRIEYGQEKLYWNFHDVSITERPIFNQPLILRNIIDIEAKLVLNDSAILSKLEPKLQKNHLPRFSMPISNKSILCWSAVVLILLLGIVKFTPYLFENFAIKYIPSSVEKSLGDYAEKTIADEKTYCNSPLGKKALNKISQRFSLALGHNNDFQIEIIEEQEVNAVALPNGKILVFSGLLNITESPEELAGIIAHELGHIIKHHPTKNFIGSLGFDIFIHIILGKSPQNSAAASLASVLLQTKYSRKMEMEADAIAAQVLDKANLSSDGLISFFNRIDETNTGISHNLLQYISSHPKTTERLNTIKAISSKPSKITTLLQDKEWKSLKSICS